MITQTMYPGFSLPKAISFHVGGDDWGDDWVQDGADDYPNDYLMIATSQKRKSLRSGLRTCHAFSTSLSDFVSRKL